MYALLTWWQLADPATTPASRHTGPSIAPLVHDSPGFLEAFWTYDRANGKSVGFALLESAEHALDLRNAIEQFAESSSDATERLELVRVEEILSHASSNRPP